MLVKDETIELLDVTRLPVPVLHDLGPLYILYFSNRLSYLVALVTQPVHLLHCLLFLLGDQSCLAQGLLMLIEIAHAVLTALLMLLHDQQICI